jgi:hypothetical protein
MHIWRQVAQKAWDATWEKVVGQTALTIMIAVLIFLVVFVIARIWRGKEFANDWLFESIAGACAVIVVFGIVFLAEALIIVPIHMIAGQQSQIGDLTNTVASLTVSNGNLSTANSTLQKTVEKDDAVLKAVAVITGITNGTFAENLEKIPSRLDEMQADIKNTQSKLFAARKQESFRVSDTNRILLYSSTNHGPRIFFKLKHIPIKNSIEGITQSPMGQMPLWGIESRDNIIWITVFNFAGLDQNTFTFTYSLSGNDTNIFKTLWINNGDVYFDNHRQVFVDIPDE